MSDNIPFEIQEQIIKRVLHVKSLLRFRSVSKQWKALIDSSKFITHHYNINQTKPDHLLVRYIVASETKYLSIVDDDSFPQQKFTPVGIPTVKRTIIFDASYGLVFFYGGVHVKNQVVVWNPSIGKSVTIDMPHGSRAFGFGVCSKTLDPKILKYTPSEIDPVDWPLEVFSLSSRASRAIAFPMNKPLLLEFIACVSRHEVIDGVIYWLGYDDHYMIVTFDLTAEEFGLVELPDNLASLTFTGDELVYISKIKGSLVVIDMNEIETVDVWMLMKDGFAKLYSVSFDAYGFYPRHIIGFRKNGEPIREHPCGTDASLVTLEAYEPSTKQSTDLGTYVAYEPSTKQSSDIGT